MKLVAGRPAEGNGRFTVADRRNFLGIAPGTVRACVPLLDIALRRQLLPSEIGG